MEIKILREKIQRYIQLENSRRSELTLILVANVEGQTTQYDDYTGTSVLSEYYTLDEFETISTAYKHMGYQVFTFFSEYAFIEAIINSKIPVSRENMLVINSAQTGIYAGRKSLIPAFCEYLKIKHTGSNPYVVSLCRDKFHTHTIINNCLHNHVEIYLYSADNGWLANKAPRENTKVIAKLNGESASIGLSNDNVFTYSSESDKYIAHLSKKYHQPIVIQPFISGYELELPLISGKETFPILGVGISVNGRKNIGDTILDYDTRFNHSYTFYNYDNYNHKLIKQIKNDAINAAQILGIEGIGRIDFRIDTNGSYYISDIATNPHITGDASVAYAFNELGYSYTDLLSVQLGVTLSKYS